jgi:hypothetical protein
MKKLITLGVVGFAAYRYLQLHPEMVETFKKQFRSATSGLSGSAAGANNAAAESAESAGAQL